MHRQPVGRDVLAQRLDQAELVERGRAQVVDGAADRGDGAAHLVAQPAGEGRRRPGRWRASRPAARAAAPCRPAPGRRRRAGRAAAGGAPPRGRRRSARGRPAGRRPGPPPRRGWRPGGRRRRARPVSARRQRSPGCRWVDEQPADVGRPGWSAASASTGPAAGACSAGRRRGQPGVGGLDAHARAAAAPGRSRRRAPGVPPSGRRPRRASSPAGWRRRTGRAARRRAAGRPRAGPVPTRRPRRARRPQRRRPRAGARRR